MKILFFNILIALTFIHCTEIEPSITPQTPENPVFQLDSLYYLALGDSYTIGESVPENERYPVQLGDSLLSNITNKEVRIIARTGWTTENLLQGIEDTPDLRATYDLVSLLIGVNNQYQGRTIEEYDIDFRVLLEKAIDFAGGDTSKVFVISIPDYAYTPFGNGNSNISQEIDAFNLVNKTITTEYNIQYFDITPISRQGIDQPELVALDGLHPSGEQYRRWVELILEDVKEILDK